MGNKAYQLIVRAGPNPGKIYPIMRSEITIGRDPNSDILINDAEISRRHAVIKLVPEGYTIEDLGSTNGTIINGQRIIGPHLLRAGEMINLGENIALIFEPQQTFDPDATIASVQLHQPQTPPYPPGKPVQVHSSFPTGSPSYGAGIPAVQVPVTRPVPEEFPADVLPQEVDTGTVMPTRSISLLIAVVILTLVAAIAFLFFIDSHYLWCKVLPFLQACAS